MPTILVVDDDPKFIAAAERMLSDAGYQVLHAVDGREAVATLESRHDDINLAIVDLSLPGVNGFELIGAISRRPRAMKIIATTGLYADTFLEMTEALGAHAVIRKPAEGRPIPQGEWLATVRQLLEDQPASRANAAGARTFDSEMGHGPDASQ